MTLQNKKLRTRILAGTAAVALSLGVVSCSEAEDAANSASDAASSGTSAVGSAINDATGSSETTGAETSDASPSSGTDDDPAAGGESTEVESADGSMISIPTAVVTAAEKAGFSIPESVEEGANGEALVTFPEGYIANSEESGAQPLVGMIGESWINEGGLAASVGLPTAPEEATDNGWTQQFASGVISWIDNGTGEYTAEVQPS
ncbi:hypothetical protein ccrud_07150 [Corynebacterium crudilactis]|uniref:Secreted protein n=1 Tax=Corynebacterium crudilactis TaxID=1652495 RepID=A0A172QX96_9CORY|nr:hypothetical protein ccrud_07150 [Corynebacterium crudilactis]